MGLIFGLIRLATLLFTMLFVTGIALIGFLVIAGGGTKPACATTAAGPLGLATKAIAFDTKVAGLAGPLTSVTFDEAETSARAEVYFGSRTDRISDVAVCFKDGSATGFLRVDAIFGRKVAVQGSGSLNLTGEHPHLDLSDASVAGVGLPAVLRDRVQDRINHELEGIPLFTPLGVQIATDRATVSR